jgi:hypoxanthine phosphoribosyltransferase
MIRQVAARIDTLFEGKEIVVVCILKGCVYFYVDLTRYMTIPFSSYFIEASSYHNRQTQAETVELLRYQQQPEPHHCLTDATVIKWLIGAILYCIDRSIDRAHSLTHSLSVINT